MYFNSLLSNKQKLNFTIEMTHLRVVLTIDVIIFFYDFVLTDSSGERATKKIEKRKGLPFILLHSRVPSKQIY